MNLEWYRHICFHSLARLYRFGLWFLTSILVLHQQGNALLPPGSLSLEGISAIHNRLNKDCIEKWKRGDVLGILMAAYAMLLRSSPAAMSSPRFSSSGRLPDNAMDIRKAWRECLESPAEQCSFTFARICMIPALSYPVKPLDEEYFSATAPLLCEVSEFLHSVLADFGSQYLEVLSASGESPISRAKWLQDTEDDLRLRRSHQEKQRNFQGHFQNWSDSEGLENVPATVDLLKRPDCMDDVIAFATAICALGPEFVLPFWKKELHIDDSLGDGQQRENVKLSPSRALEDLQTQQEKDSSLSPSYLSFLAALALAQNRQCLQNGAEVVYSILQNSTVDQKKTDWATLIDVIRWYVRELDPHALSTRSNKSVSSSKVTTSSAYYYDDRENPNEQKSSSQIGGESSTYSKPHSLGEENTYILLSHLAVISNVAANCPSARSEIISINLPIVNTENAIIGQDSALMILFKLALLPLTPDVRGAVFGTLSSLLSTDGLSGEEAASIHGSALKSWELLESCQIIPISLLEQYPTRSDPVVQDGLGLTFPLSSTSLVRYCCKCMFHLHFQILTQFSSCVFK